MEIDRGEVSEGSERKGGRERGDIMREREGERVRKRDRAEREEREERGEGRGERGESESVYDGERKEMREIKALQKQ